VAPIIEVQHVSKIFGPRPDEETRALLETGAGKDEVLRRTGHVVGLYDVSLEIERGEVFVVMGLSGSGKSTLIRCLNRLIDPSSGAVIIDGQDITKLGPKQLQDVRRRKMGMVFQNFGLLPHKSVLDNVAFGQKVQRVPQRERLVGAYRALELVGLADWADSKPAGLSGGMQQRVGLARALCTDPDILLMDEAFSALDPLIRRQMQDEMLQLQERMHKTIVFITHDLNEALRVGNRVAIMQDGVVVQVGTPTEIVTTPATKYVADFIQDVDQGRVLPIDYAATEAATVPLAGSTVGQALAVARQSEDAAVYVVDAAGRPVGLALETELRQADVDGMVADHLVQDFPVIDSKATLAQGYAVCAAGKPVAVTDADGRLKGVVHPLDVLDRLGQVESIAERGFEGEAALAEPGGAA
jgi:glycine betaine/proline transport system ATP-binding protein